MEYVWNNLIFCTKTIVIDGYSVWHVSVRPPMDNKTYDEIKYILERMGGHWRERFGGFIFRQNPDQLFLDNYNWREIDHDEYTKWRIMRQFYPTPEKIAKRVVELAEIQETDTVLEPSAGKGALLKALPSGCRTVSIEIDSSNAEYLRSLNYNVVESSFEDWVDLGGATGITKVVMNPPFSGQRDIKHILLAYDVLEEGGTLVAIMSENDLYYNTSLTKQFNAFIQEHDAYIEEIPMGGFVGSNTLVDTVIIKIVKKIRT